MAVAGPVVGRKGRGHDRPWHDLPAGHRLALVIDTADPLYFDANPNGVKISFTGASWFDVPLR